ncbi:hypothetical protein Tco_0808561 [Tanacetum coccineum]
MMVQATENMGEDLATLADSHSTPIHTQPSSSKPQKQKSRRKQRKDSGPTEPIPDEATNEEHLETKSKEFEKRRKSRTSGFKRLRKVGSASRVESSNDVCWKSGKLSLKKVVEEPVVSVATTTKSIPVSVVDLVTTVGEVVTTANVEVTIVSTPTTTINNESGQTLIEIKQLNQCWHVFIGKRPKAKGIVFHDKEEQAYAFTPIVSSSQLPQVKDKGKGKLVEPEKPLKKKYQIALDEELALRLQAKELAELEKERVAHQEASREAIIKELDNIQAMIDAD